MLAFVGLLVVFTSGVGALGARDVNGDGRVDSRDAKIVLGNWLSSVAGAFDVDENGKTNSQDIAYVIRDFGQTVASPSPAPTSPPGGGGSAEWTQHAHDAQRSGWTTQTLNTPWRFAWLRSDVDVRTHYEVFPVTGGGRVYVAAANNQVYALNINNGSTVWSRAPGGSLYSSPAYDPNTDRLFVTAGNSLYRLNASNGNYNQQNDVFTASSALETSPLIVGDKVYITATNGNLYALNKDGSTLTQEWVYDPTGSIGQVTMPSYSVSRNAVIYGADETADDRNLYVIAVNANNGSQKWRVTPSVNNYFCGQMGEGPSCYEFRNNWPVIADNAGIVLIAMRNGYDAIYFGSGDEMPETNLAIKQALESNPKYQSLFALDLDDGSRAFTPAVKYGAFGNGSLGIGPQPAVRTLPNGKQVAYVIYSNGQTCANQGWCDYREDATMGEMVLDNNTVCPTQNTCLQAGDVRFVKFIDIQTDEQGMLSGSGDMLFHSHWYAVLSGVRITDRSDNLGATFGNPIRTSDTPFVITQHTGCSCSPGGDTHYCSGGLCTENGARRYPPGFFVGTSGWHLNPYVIVSNNHVIVKSMGRGNGNESDRGGDIFVLEKGNPG